ncbi:hypothetical protein [Paractinoplanes toevensis]|uniref:Uncharacterized protein n=1 Tax=Paractinoplanes toevensis TaxID=571911 RepID=A0A919W5C7_9ACTN|nr:hypothetical protein [Actinoplanes toevensis]GIM91128.1 hypothetical protein Ato02nite_029210 [Actinoplanes toevensis]
MNIRRWIADPFVRGLTGLPLALAAVPMAPAGRSAAAGRRQLRVAARFPGPGAGPGAGSAVRDIGVGRVLGHSALMLVPAALAFALAAMQLFLAWSGYLYPLRPDTIAALGHPFTPDRQVLPGAWGGPTLAGAWAVHAAVALGSQAVCAVLLVGLCVVQNAGARWLAKP